MLSRKVNYSYYEGGGGGKVVFQKGFLRGEWGMGVKMSKVGDSALPPRMFDKVEFNVGKNIVRFAGCFNYVRPFQ